MPDGSEQRVAEQTTSAATHPAESQESNPSSRSPAPPASTDYEEANVNREVSDSSETDHDKHPPQDGTVGKIVGAELESGDVEGNADPNVQQQTKLQKQVSIADQTNLLPKGQVITVVLGCAVCLCLALLDQTIVATALPTIGRDLGDAQNSSWVASAFLLTSTAFAPIWVRMSDIFGRKQTIITAMTLFFFGSMGCALAQTMTQLIILRAFAGASGGSLISLVMSAIISDVVSMRDRGKYQGLMGTLRYPMASGLSLEVSYLKIPPGVGVFDVRNFLPPASSTYKLTHTTQLPLGGFAIAVVFFAMPLRAVKGSKQSKLAKIDYIGCVLTLASTCLVVLGLTWAGATYPWGSAPVLAPLCVGIGVAVLFCLWEWKMAKLPIIPLHIFKIRNIAVGMVATLVNGYLVYWALFGLSQFFQVVRGDTPTAAGVLLLPLIVPQVVVSGVSGFIVSKTGRFKEIIAVGWVLYAVAIGVLSIIDEHSSKGMIVGLLIFTAIGAGQTFQTVLVAMQVSVEKRDVAVTTGARNFVRLLGGVLGLAVSQTIINSSLRSATSDLPDSLVDEVVSDPTAINNRLASSIPSATIEQIRRGYVDGFQTSFVVCGALGGLATLCALCLEPKSLDRGDEAEQKEKSKQWLAQRKAKKQGLATQPAEDKQQA